MKINNTVVSQKNSSINSAKNNMRNIAIPKNSPSFGSVEGMGKNIITGFLSKFAKSIEYINRDMPFPVLLTAMFAGVLAPRVIKAQDNFDREEIIRRDSITITTIVFGAPLLSKMFSKVNEMRSGLALTIKPTLNSKGKPLTTTQHILNYLRPVNGVHVLHTNEIVKKYSKIDEYNEGAVGFCKFIDEQNGNLKKVFSLTKETKGLVEELCGGEKAFANADNKKIIEAIKSASEEKLEKLCTHFAKEDNAFIKKAKSINSTFGFISMVCLVPLFLGVLLPKMNEKITKRKIAEHKNSKLNTKPAEHHQIYQNPYFMASAQEDKTVFNSFNKNN